MAAEIPIIPKAESILLRSGNVVNWNRLKKKLTQSPSEELSDCLSSTIEGWLHAADKTQLQYANSIECNNKKYLEPLSKEERSELKLTVKIFLSSLKAEAVLDAVETVSADLGVEHIEQVLLSVQSVPKDDSYIDTVLPLYQTLEDLHQKEKIYGIGVSDLDKDQLEPLYEAAQVKPIIDQVNLTSCCVMPPELVEYAKTHDIQLLTHNDPTDILPSDIFQSILKNKFTEKDSIGWKTIWVVRYSIVVKCRGIIKGKGYIAKVSRDLHMYN